jgi:hypothetical protein
MVSVTRKQLITTLFIIGLLCTVFGTIFGATGAVHAQCEIESTALLGSIDFDDWAGDVAVSGSYAYVGTIGSGVKVVDVSNPMMPELVATIEMPYYVLDIEISEPYAFVSDGFLNIIDISDPTAPVVICSLEEGVGAMESIVLSGSYVYAACWWDGLKIIDISDPYSPQLVGSVETGAIARDVAVAGSHAYVSHWGEDVAVVDISVPSAPIIVGTIEGTSGVWAVTVTGSHAYLADSYAGKLMIADISDPSSASVVGSIHTGYAFEVSVSGSYAYLVDGKIEVIDISNPTSPHLVNSVWGGSNVSALPDKSATDAVIVGSMAYVAYQNMGLSEGGGLRVIDISSKRPLPIVNKIDASAPHLATDMVVSGEYAYMARGMGGIEVLDISDPATPIVAQTIETSDSAQGLAVSGSYLYEADRLGGLNIIDISDPLSPSIVASVAVPDWAMDVEISGAHAYVASDSGLQVIDISNPLSPGIVGSTDAVGGINSVAVSGSIACVISDWFTVRIVDVTDPTDPKLLGTVDIPNQTCALGMSGSYAYVADFYSGIHVIDLTDPQNPYISASLGTPAYVQDIEIYDSLMFVSGGSYGTALNIMDVSDPAFPRTLASADLGYSYDGAGVVAASDSYAYVGDINVVQFCRDPLATPTIAVSATSLTASNDQGVKPPHQSFEVSNSGDGALSYVLSSDAWWLGFSPVMGGSLGESDTIDVWFSTKNSSPGDHTARLFIADPAATNSPQEINVTVTVYPVPCSLSTDVSPPEGGSVTEGGVYDYYDVVTLEAYPNPGWLFKSWLADDDSYVDGSRGNPEEIRIDGHENVTAVFKIHSPMLTVNGTPSGGGSVSGYGRYDYGETVTVEARPTDGWRFVHWEGDDIDGSTVNPEQILMDAGKTITAVFELVLLTHINLVSPSDGGILAHNSVFRWTTGAGTNNAFAVDISFSPTGPFYSSYENLREVIERESWRMPDNIFRMIPSGTKIYWRVRGIDLDAAERIIVRSDEVWTFTK